MKVICFDLDGTLCDLEYGEKAARDTVIEQLALNDDKASVAEVFDREWGEVKQRYWEYIVQGLEEQEIRAIHMGKVVEKLGVKADPSELAETFCSEAMKHLVLYPESVTVLMKLKAMMPLCLLSNGPSGWQRAKITKLELQGYFEHIIISGEVGHHKPDPMIFDILKSKYPDAEITYIGNNYMKDIVGAKNAGLRAIWVNRLGEVFDEAVKPDAEIRTLSGLFSLMDSC